MRILVINCHPDNRGDEAAIHAMVDEISAVYPDVEITLSIRGAGTNYPNMSSNVRMIQQFMPISKKAKLAHDIAVLTRGRVAVSRLEKILIEEIRKADIVLHAPGGPSIGDTYYEDEPTYLKIYDLLQAMRKPYMFYAPSMGPFEKIERNEWRKKVLENAKAIVLRDPISAAHVKRLLPGRTLYQTLDSALQHDIDIKANEKKMDAYNELKEFLASHEKCVGITITDLLWHPVHSKNEKILHSIEKSFSEAMRELVGKGYGIVFVPQLYGNGNDYNLMRRYATNNKDFFIIPDNDTRYDTYFQQYLIGKLFAVIGMRYHSNIFSAKMGTPFISVSYEQKMQGFMEKMCLSQYCIKINDLSAEELKKKFELLEENHKKYKKYLEEKHSEMKNEAYRTTEILNETINAL